MKEELERKLVERWPTWFDVNGSIKRTLMPFGFEHGDGWLGIVWRLCEQLEPAVNRLEKETGRKFEVFQVKEKFGGLRFYCDSSTDEIDALIRAAEEESTRTCDVCGRQGTARGGSWIRTRCDEHDDVNG
jgi:hypothetical protein